MEPLDKAPNAQEHAVRLECNSTVFQSLVIVLYPSVPRLCATLDILSDLFSEDVTEASISFPIPAYLHHPAERRHPAQVRFDFPHQQYLHLARSARMCVSVQ